MPAETEFIQAVPRIFYTCGRIKLRSADFMWYALLFCSLPGEMSFCLWPAALCTLATLVAVVFVLPFMGFRYRRPLPFAVMCLIPVLGLFAVSAPDFTQMIRSPVFGG
jgi:hypothetical protein